MDVVMLQRDVLDGVTTFWVDSGRPTLAASLIFRGGIADETLPTMGWLHVIEHLALHGRQSGPLHVNGSVSLLNTQLDLHGPPDAVTRTLTEICAWLRDPDLGHLPKESKVLAAESAYRGAGDAAVALLQRYGARGPGLAGYAELGLARADPDGIAGLVARVFTSGNGVLVLDGPPPSDLSPALPDGVLLPLPEAKAVIDARAAAYHVQGSRMVVSGEVQRSTAATFLPGVLQDVFRRELRERAGGAYAPWASYEAVSRETAVVVAGSDVSGDLRQSVVSHTLHALGQLRSEDAIAAPLADLRASALQALNDPHQSSALAWRAGHTHLRGESPQELDEIIDEMEAATPSAVLEQAQMWRTSLLLGVPFDARWDNELPLLTMPTQAEPAGGSTYRSANFPANRTKLRLTSQALAVGEGETWASIALSDVAGLMKVPDGGRRLVAEDGWSLMVEPNLWRRGPDAVAELDAAVPPSLHIPVDDRPYDQRPQPLPAKTRWLSLLGTPTGLVSLGVVCFVIAGLAVLGTGSLAAGLFFAVPGVIFIKEVRKAVAEEGRP